MKRFFLACTVLLSGVAADSCLPEHKLQRYVAASQMGLTTLSGAILAGAALVEDETLQKQLTDTAQALQNVAQNFLPQLKDVLKEPCKTCPEIVQLSENLVMISNDEIAKIKPDWTTSPLWVDSLTLFKSVAEATKSLCPHQMSPQLQKFLAPTAAGPEPCLNAALADKYGFAIGVAFETVADAVASSMKLMNDTDSREKMAMGANIIRGVKDKFLPDLMKVASDKMPCGKCSQWIEIVEALGTSIYGEVGHIMPTWTKDPFWVQIDSLVNSTANLSKDLCPDGPLNAV